MKKILLWIMVFSLTFSMPAYMTSAQEPAGVTDEIVIAEYNFENGLDGFASHNGGRVGLSEDGDNRYMSLTYNYSAEEITRLSGGNRNFGSDYATIGYTKSMSVPLDVNKKYFFRFKSRWENGSHGKFREIITRHGIEHWLKINPKGTEDGWTVFESELFDNKKFNNNTLTNIYLKSNIHAELADAMVATKSYHGTGIGSNGGNWKIEVDGREYTFREDCSLFGSSEDKVKALSDYLEDNKIAYYIDDIQLISEATFFEDTITVKGGKLPVTALVNTATGETHDLSEGGKIRVNDYFGTKYTIEGVTKYVKVNGEEIITKYENGKTTFSFLPEDVNKNRDIEIALDIITESTPFISNLKITGDKKPGSLITASYDYICNSEDASVFRWQRLEGDVWTDIDGANSKSYVLKESDKESYLRLIVTAKSAAGEVWRDVTAVFYTGDIGYYVATDGDDSSDGTIDRPFATVQRAKDEIASLKAKGALPQGEIVVNIRGGDYRLTDTLEFGKADSGTENTKIIYRAYNGEKVRFMGSQNISADNVSKVTSHETDSFGRRVLDSITDTQAKSNLYKIDLSGFDGEFPASQSVGYIFNGEGRDPQNTTAFKPVIVYVNNEALTEARWPNREADTAMLISERATGNLANGGTVGYPDPDGRSALWNEAAVEAEARVDLHTNSNWYSVRYDIADFDSQNKRFSVTDGNRATASGYPLYFTNILEEIDMPGESFIDSGAKVVYFYPSTDLTDAEIEVSTFEENMVSIDGACNLVFEGLDFVFTKQTPFAAKNVDGLTVKDCVFAHSSYGLADVRGTNITVENCHIYDSQYSGMTIGGGDRKNAVASGNIVKNCIFHESGRLQTAYVSSLQVVDTFGCTITGNLFYDNPHMLLGMGTVGQVADVMIENNEFHHGVTEHGDMGSIYWGRNPSMLGITIRNNYFHQNGNIYNNGWNQSIFVDDGAFGADIHSNIFWQGTLPESRGGTAGRSYPIKTNGGQFMNVHNNIMVDMPSAVYFQDWGDRFTLYNYGVQYTKSGSSVSWSGNTWNNTSGPYCDNPAWEECFRGTMWEPFFDVFSNERYDSLQLLKSNNDTAGVDAYIKSWKPVAENVFDNNVCVEMSVKSGFNTTGSTKKGGVNYVHSDKSADKKYLFRDYGTDFSLSDEGLAEVRKTLPGFENIDTSVIGITDPVDGFAPVVSGASFGGQAQTGKTLSAVYAYTDRDGDKEGHSYFMWYQSDTKDGEYTVIKGKTARDILLTEAQNGKYVKYKVTGVDRNNRYGNTTESEPVLISSGEIKAEGISLDKTSLELTSGDDGLLTATIYPSDATERNVTWQSSDESVASVTGGLVTANLPGTATVYAVAADGTKPASCIVTVKPAPFEITDLSTDSAISFNVSLPYDKGFIIAALYDSKGRLVESAVKQGISDMHFIFAGHGTKIKVFWTDDNLRPFAVQIEKEL